VSGLEPERVLVHGRPGRLLQPWVLGFEGYREQAMTPFVMREVPRGFAVLIIGFGAPFGVGLAEHGLRGAASYRSFLAGPHDRAALVSSSGWSYCIQVNLTLPGAVRLLGMPLRELANRIVTLEDVVPGVTELTERLYLARGWPRRFVILDEWLLCRLAQAAGPSVELEWAWHRLDDMAGVWSVAGLAEEIGCSRKHLSLRFHDTFGLPPSTMAQLLRFARILGRLERDPARSLAALALDCGYSDQPHLNRAFRRFAGVTPTAYLRARMPPPGGLAEPR